MRSRFALDFNTNISVPSAKLFGVYQLNDARTGRHLLSQLNSLRMAVHSTTWFFPGRVVPFQSNISISFAMAVEDPNKPMESRKSPVNPRLLVLLLFNHFNLKLDSV